MDDMALPGKRRDQIETLFFYLLGWVNAVGDDTGTHHLKAVIVKFHDSGGVADMAKRNRHAALC